MIIAIYNLFLVLLIFNAVLALGSFVLKKIIEQDFNHSILSFAISTMIGYGILGYILVLFSFFSPINSIVVVLMLLALAGFGLKDIYYFYLSAYENLKLCKFKNTENKLLKSGILFFVIFYFSSVFMPPYRVDALAYHIPEATEIALHGVLSIGGIGNFLSNAPKLMEALYSLGIIFNSYFLMNIIHFQIALAFLMIIQHFIKTKFSERAGLLSVLSIFLVYEFWVNATNPYVDAAAASFEIVGILYLLNWVQDRKKTSIILAGVFYGFALSIKYLSLYSLVISLLFLLFLSLVRKEKFRQYISTFIYFVLPILIVSGFWYLKSWFITGNPFYPFIFGHVGINDNNFQNAVFAVKQFESRGIISFLLMPFNHFTSGYYYPVLLAFITLPIGLLIKSKKNLHYLIFYAVSLFATWFFLISHQKRFGLPGIIILMIVASIVILDLFDKSFNRVNIKLVNTAIVISAALLIIAVIFNKNSYFLKVKGVELRYIFGSCDNVCFYKERGLNQVFQLSNYINSNFTDTTFINLWNDQPFFLKNGNLFLPPDFVVKENFNVDIEKLFNLLKIKKIDYIISISAEEKNEILQSDYYNQNPEGIRYRKDIINPVIIFEDKLVEKSTLIYAEEGRKLYKLR